MRSMALTLLMAGPAIATAATAAAPAPPEPGAQSWREWRCELAYLPARSTWVRRIALRADAQQVLQIRVDDQVAHSFAVRDTLVLTSMDGEHIAFDVGTGLWESDFRGAAQGRGRCDPMETPADGS